MSCENIPSISDLEKVKLNADDFGRLMGTGEGTSTNGVTGQVRPTYNKVIKDLGFKPGSGDFTTGFTVMPGERDVAWYDPVSKNWYSYLGIIPSPDGHPVSPGTNPVGSVDWAPRTDGILREDLASNEGSGLVGVGDETVASLLVNRNFTPGVHGAVGNGIVDDTAPVASALAEAKEAVTLAAGKKYLVTSINNPNGKPFIGPGQLVKAVTGGLEMQNSYVDAYQRMTGQENLAHWFKALLQPTANPTIVFSGDSTTAGDGTTADYKIHLLVKRGLRARGLQTAYGINSLNKGHSGDTAAQWAATYVTQDIADNPDLYVVRWGINDVKDVDSFATNLRAGLTTYRNAKPFASSSILLMMPNSTYDIPNSRDAKWYEQLKNVLVQTARDFKCAFLDTYAITQNSKGLAGILMDDPYSDGRGIHPNDMLNSIIAGYILDTIAPFGAATGYSKNDIMMTAGVESPATNTTLLPIQYDGAINIIRTQPAYGWPLDGNAITFKTQDGTAIQYNFGYLDADRGKLFARFGRATLGGQPEGWSEFYQLDVRFPSAAIATAGVFQPGSAKCNKHGSLVNIDGKLTTSTQTNIAIGQTIGTVPVGYRPTRDPMYGVATMIPAALNSFIQVPINVATDGQLSVAAAVSNVSYIYLSISYDIL